MAQIGQILYNVYTPLGGVQSTLTKEKFYDTNLTEGKTWSKVSIQAPPGTIVEIGGQEVLIGRTGIYETLPGVTISSLVFEQPTQIVKDNEAGQEAIEEGWAQVETAAQNISTEVAKGMNSAQLNLLEEYGNKFAEGLFNYESGLRGIYIEGDSIDLINIIIDYIVEEGGQQ